MEFTIAICVALINVLGKPFSSLLRRWFTRKATIGAQAVQMRVLREVMVEMRTLLDADRISFFQFHNGSHFVGGQPVWRFSNIAEVCKAGVESHYHSEQGLLSTHYWDIFARLFSDDVSSKLSDGKKVPCTCCDDRDICKSSTGLRFVDVVDPRELPASQSRAMLEEQGVSLCLQSLVFGASGKKPIGFVSVDYARRHTNFWDASSKVEGKVLCRRSIYFDYIARAEFVINNLDYYARSDIKKRRKQLSVR